MDKQVKVRLVDVINLSLCSLRDMGCLEQHDVVELTGLINRKVKNPKTFLTNDDIKKEIEKHISSQQTKANKQIENEKRT